MSVKENRVVSFTVLGAVYLLASAVGFFVYSKLPWNFTVSLLVADVAATVVTFVFSLIFSNASVYDPYWSVAPLVVITALALYGEMNFQRWLILIAICVWAIRLTLNWAYTFENLTCQDWRYTHYKKLTGFFYPVVNFFGIHLMPTLIVYFCMLPAVMVMVLPTDFSIFALVGFAISICAVILQGTADYQMHSFRKEKTGTFIRGGVWKYSRHPNYLGEILMWWGIAVTGVSLMPDKPWLCFGAVINTLLFVFISIPLADGKQSKKDGFEEYKSETRMLLPIPKRNS